MPVGIIQTGVELVSENQINDQPITYNVGLASKTPAYGTQPTVPASTGSVINTLGTNAWVYLYNGTVTVVTIGGNTVATTSNVSLFMPAKQTISLTYSVAPSWYWQAM